MTVTEALESPLTTFFRFDFRTTQNRLKRNVPAPNWTVTGANAPQLQIKGFRIESSDKEPSHGDDNIPELLVGSTAVLRLFGSGFTEQTAITFTEELSEFGGPCQISKTELFHVQKDSVTPHGDSVLVEIRIPKTTKHFYFCARQAENTTAGLVRS